MEVGAELEKRDADLHKCTDKAPVASSMRLVAFIGMIVSRVPQGTLGEPLEVKGWHKGEIWLKWKE